MNTGVMFSSAKGDWETPQDFFDTLHHEFGFTLDAAASAQNAKCARYFDEGHDGLSREWEGVVWCNPPYGRDVGRWVRKGLESGKKADVVMLLPARTDTKWFHDYILGKAEIRFIRGRLKFGGCKNSAPFPSMVVVFRREVHGCT